MHTKWLSYWPLSHIYFAVYLENRIRSAYFMLFFQNVNQSNTYTFIYEYIHIQLSTILLHFLFAAQICRAIRVEGSRCPRSWRRCCCSSRSPFWWNNRRMWSITLWSTSPNCSRNARASLTRIKAPMTSWASTHRMPMVSGVFYFIRAASLSCRNPVCSSSFFFYFRLQSNSIACPVNFFLA